ncbi:MAG: hypothetical protein LH474_00080 [Chamaesiphon sp.]|nr:hypothetical protein [Chamaesiphon sp.]
MLNRINKSVQVSWISAFLLSIASWNSLPAHAVDGSQILGGKVTWECDLSATVESTIRSNQDNGKHGLSCRSTQSAADPAAVNELVQQGIQLLQQAQTLAAADPAAMEQLVLRGIQLLQTSQPTTTSNPAVQQLIQQGLQLLQTAPQIPAPQSRLPAPQ